VAVDHARHCDLLAAEVESYAATIVGAPLDVAVPSCPGWSLWDLTAHLGSVHRWAEHLVRVAAPERISSAAMGLEEPDPSPAWVRSGGDQLVATLRGADPGASMWAWGADQHVRFWSRRQLHETLVHRMDAELALGRPPSADAAVAADAIDEFLANLSRAAYFSPRVKDLRGEGERLAFRPTDQDRSWVVTLRPDGFEAGPGDVAPGGAGRGGAGTGEPAPVDAQVAGPALTLLLVLYRRLPINAPGVSVTGDPAVTGLWLANSALE